jgi:hypothetical protein
MKRYAVLLLPVLLVGCGTLPQPFLGRPGPEGALLSIPPPPVLIIPPPHDALLGNAAAQRYAQDLATALVAQDVPSIAQGGTKFDWRLIAEANTAGDKVTPTFTIVGPTGHTYGHATGVPVSAEAWSDGDASVLQATAASAAPELARQLSAINASVQQSNPRSLENRPARILLSRVTGAPGDGNHALSLDVQRDLTQMGIVVVPRTEDADFIISGVVKISPGKAADGVSPSDVVELDWLIRSQSGAFIGKVSQLHDLEPSQMSPYWGDVAVAAAEQASLGIKQVIVNAIPKRALQTVSAAAKPPASAMSAKSPGP